VTGAVDPTRDRGAADALGLVLIAPVVVALALLVVSLGRSVESRSETQSAAESAAQAAALERSPSAARAAADDVVEAMLTNADTCGSPVVDVDTSEFRPGGRVAVTVTCSASNRGVEVVQPDAREHSTRAVARIDQFRAVEGP
jgi:Flp pilus assembly protein TadG